MAPDQSTISTNDQLDRVGLRARSLEQLTEESDFSTYWSRDGTRVENNIKIVYRSKFAGITAEYFRCVPKVRFSLVLDEQEIPFATVTYKRQDASCDTYETHVEILPCMIPEALVGLSAYMNTHPVLMSSKSSQDERDQYLLEVVAVQMGLYALLKSTLDR
jgi:hypothetical protein